MASFPRPRDLSGSVRFGRMGVVSSIDILQSNNPEMEELVLDMKRYCLFQCTAFIHTGRG